MSSPVPSYMPAMKVGGRRMSFGRKRSGSTTNKETKETTDASAPEAAEGEAAQQEQEEEQEHSKREKKRDHPHGHEARRDARWVDNNNVWKKNTYGGAGRISQPAGKGFAS